VTDLLLSGLVSGHPAEYFILDAELRVTQCSAGAPRYAESPSALNIGSDVRHSFPEFVGAEDHLYSVLRGDQPHWRIRGIDRSPLGGPPFYIAIAAERQLLSASEPPSLVVLLDDVTESLTLEQKAIQSSHDARLLLHALTVSKEYLECILNSMVDALFVTSTDGIIDTVNRAALELLQYSKMELIGKPITSVAPDEELIADINTEPVTPVVVDKRDIEVLCKRKDGTAIPVSFTRTLVETDLSISRGVLFVGRDLSERKRAEAEISKLHEEKVYLQEEIKSDRILEEIVGSSPAIKRVFGQIQKVAATDTTVLLMGETGTGKELIARAIHNLSGRRNTVLVKVNCAALPSGLVESELFGHEKGAFTGAVAKKMGRFELANNGTILLDEVGELPLDTQAKLLRVLQEQEFERVGGTQPLQVNVRVIASTNRNLEESVNVGAFRRDLFYRLNVFPIYVPLLRERTEDIPSLAHYFIGKFSRRMNKRIEGVSKKGMESLLRYSWPGNVRELASVLERAVVLSEGGVLTDIDLAVVTGPRGPSGTNKDSLQDVERRHIMEVLEEAKGVIEGPHGAAQRLGVNPATLRSRMKKLGIQRIPPAFDLAKKLP
jgi:PAS domain S-box-containing protein